MQATMALIECITSKENLRFFLPASTSGQIPSKLDLITRKGEADASCDRDKPPSTTKSPRPLPLSKISCTCRFLFDDLYKSGS